MYVHNQADLPGLTIWSPENSGPAAVWIVLFILWVRFRPRRWVAGCLAAWGWLNLLGGLLTVLPLPFLPFAPDQSLRHYGFHLLAAAAVVPFLVLAGAELRRTRPRREAALG